MCNWKRCLGIDPQRTVVYIILLMWLVAISVGLCLIWHEKATENCGVQERTWQVGQ